MLLTPNPYSRCQRALKPVKAVACHYMGNPNTPAINNRNYFESLKVGIPTSYDSNGKVTGYKCASSHYIIGLQGEILRLIPENEVSFCTNQANDYTISIEACHPDSTGKFTNATYDSYVELCADICKRHGLNPLNGGLIRHYDVTGKECPRWFVQVPAEWESFKSNVSKQMNGQYVPKGTGEASMATMTPNATVNLTGTGYNNANTYSTETTTTKYGYVWNNERVQVLQEGSARFYIRYNLDAGGTKDAWINKAYIVKDIVETPPPAPVTDYKSLYESSQAELANKNNTINSLNGTISAKDGEIAGLNVKINELNGAVSNLNSEISGLKSEVSTKQEKISNLEGLASKLNNSVVTLTQEVTQITASENIPKAQPT